METALFIDDDEIFNHVHEHLAKKAGIARKIYVCSSGISGLVLLKELSMQQNQKMPDVIFLDLMMPVMDGFEFLEKLESMSFISEQETKVVIVTSSLNEADSIKAKDYRFVTDYITKPLNIEKLAELKNKLCNN